jgi:predicted PurR-regulated permease PerM
MIRRAGVITVFVIVIALVWFTRKVWLLLFAGLLVALVLTSLINLLKRLLHVGHKIGLVLALLLLAGIATGIVFLVIPTVSGQFSALSEAIPQRIEELRQKVNDSAFIQKMNNTVPEISQPGQGGASGGAASGITKFFTSTFEAASSFFFILFTGIFAAATPQLYRKMVVKLFSPRLRPKAEHTIDRIICTLRYWLLGQGVAMVVVGIVTGGALAIAGVPLAAALGIVAGLLEFIPVIGPVLSAVPAVLLAFSGGLNTVLIVIAIFVGIQFFEGNVLQPIVQKRAIDLPPVLTLVALLVFGGAFGLLGLFVAAPMTAALLVLVEDLYLKEYLGTNDRLLE